MDPQNKVNDDPLTKPPNQALKAGDIEDDQSSTYTIMINSSESVKLNAKRASNGNNVDQGQSSEAPPKEEIAPKASGSKDEKTKETIKDLENKDKDNKVNSTEGDKSKEDKNKENKDSLEKKEVLNKNLPEQQTKSSSTKNDDLNSDKKLVQENKTSTLDKENKVADKAKEIDTSKINEKDLDKKPSDINNIKPSEEKSSVKDGNVEKKVDQTKVQESGAENQKNKTAEAGKGNTIPEKDSSATTKVDEKVDSKVKENGVENKPAEHKEVTFVTGLITEKQPVVSDKESKTPAKDTKLPNEISNTQKGETIKDKEPEPLAKVDGKKGNGNDLAKSDTNKGRYDKRSPEEEKQENLRLAQLINMNKTDDETRKESEGYTASEHDTFTPDPQPRQERELVKKIEKIVQKKMAKEVNKMIDKKIGNLINEKDHPNRYGNSTGAAYLPRSRGKHGSMPEKITSSPQREPFKEDLYAPKDMKKREPMNQGKKYNEVRKDYYMNDNSSSKHTRFWEIERRMDEKKGRHHYSNYDQANSLHEPVPAKSYIASIRNQVNLPPISSNHSRLDRSRSPMEENSFQNYSYLPSIDKRDRDYSFGAEDMELINDVRPQKGRLNSRRESERFEYMPKSFEVYLGKTFSKDQLMDFENSPYMGKGSQRNKGKATGNTRSRSTLAKIVNARERNQEMVEKKISEAYLKGLDEFQPVQQSIEVSAQANPPLRNNGNNIRKVQNNDYYSKRNIRQMRDIPLTSSNNIKNVLLTENTAVRPKESRYNGPSANVSATAKILNDYKSGVSNLLRGGQGGQSNLLGGQRGSRIDKNAPFKNKRSSSVIANNNQRPLRDSRSSSRGSIRGLSRENSRERIDSGTLMRQKYRVRDSAQGDQSSRSPSQDITDEAYRARKANIEKALKQRRSSGGDYFSTLDKKGCSFTTSQRSTMIKKEFDSPGPKYDLSSYKGILGVEKNLKLEGQYGSNGSRNKFEIVTPQKPVINVSSEENSLKEGQRFLGGPLAKKTPQNLHFAPARREILFKVKPDIPGPGEYETPKLKSSPAAQFGKERKSFKGAFPSGKPTKLI